MREAAHGLQASSSSTRAAQPCFGYRPASSEHGRRGLARGRDRDGSHCRRCSASQIASVANRRTCTLDVAQ